MDILENGADRPPMRRRTRVVLLALLIVAVLAAVALTGTARSRRPAASAVLPSVPTPVVAALVDTGGGSTYRSMRQTKEFVLSVDLINFNRVPARVAGGTVPKQPAFDRLVMAVLPGVPADDETLETVAAATHTPVTITGRDKAQLVVAGRVVCAATPTSGGAFTVLVDGEEKTVDLPHSDGENWVTEIVKDLCPVR
jgi:hypothetical protein